MDEHLEKEEERAFEHMEEELSSKEHDIEAQRDALQKEYEQEVARLHDSLDSERRRQRAGLQDKLRARREKRDKELRTRQVRAHTKGLPHSGVVSHSTYDVRGWGFCFLRACVFAPHTGCGACKSKFL